MKKNYGNYPFEKLLHVTTFLIEFIGSCLSIGTVDGISLDLRRAGQEAEEV